MQQEDIFTPMFVFEIQWCRFFKPWMFHNTVWKCETQNNNFLVWLEFYLPGFVWVFEFFI